VATTKVRREEGKELDHRAALTAQPLDLVQEPAGHRHWRHLAAGHLLALRHGLAVHHREHGDRTEGVDGVHKLTAHTHEASLRRDQPGLALHWRLGQEPGRGQRRGETPGGLVIMDVPRLELDEVDLARGADGVQVGRCQDRPLAEMWADVVHQHPAGDVLRARVLTLQPVRTHSWEHRYVRLYNTLTRRKDELAIVGAGAVKNYSCGPTVYRYAHVNLRTYMFADVLCRPRVPGRPPCGS
jgi:hypothetical protein